MSVGKGSSREEGIPEGGRDVRGSSDRAGNILRTYTCETVKGWI